MSTTHRLKIYEITNNMNYYITLYINNVLNKCILKYIKSFKFNYSKNVAQYLLYNYNSVSVCPSVQRRFRVLIDATEPARTVGQFRVLIRRRNRPRQSDSENGIWPEQSDSKNGIPKRDSESARTVGFGKRRSTNGSWDSEKRAARQGRAGQGAGQGPSVRLYCRAGGRAGQAGPGPNKE